LFHNFQFTGSNSTRHRRAAGWRTAILAILTLSLPLAACDPVPDTPNLHLPGEMPNAILSAQTESLSPDEIREVMDTRADSAYVLGPNDVISITVYLHPELSVPQPGASSSVGGVMITSDGTVELPLVGELNLGGLTIKQAQQVITQAYSKQNALIDPEIAVELVSAQSLRYYLLGAFTEPGVKYPAHQLNLLEAVALGGTIQLEQADLQQAYVAQGSVKLPLDLHALLIDGDLSQNVMLAPGDAVIVPSSLSEQAYVFGSVLKPGPVQFESGGLSLLAALSGAQMDLSSYTNARLSRIHVIRSHGKSGEFLIVDANMILQGQARPFQLQPGDIVFVPPTEVATWNQVLEQLIPSLQAISDVLSPFVSLKYLRQ
jgi:polysaccharide export outer membrane protein